MFSILTAVLILALIMVVHEAGHAIPARCYGVQVREFSIGIGRRLMSVRIGETVYAVRLLPVAAFVMFPTDALPGPRTVGERDPSGTGETAADDGASRGDASLGTLVVPAHALPHLTHTVTAPVGLSTLTGLARARWQVARMVRSGLTRVRLGLRAVRRPLASALGPAGMRLIAGVRWSLRATLRFLFGLDQADHRMPEDRTRSLRAQPRSARAVILAGGVAFNIVSGAFLLTVLHFLDARADAVAIEPALRESLATTWAEIAAFLGRFTRLVSETGLLATPAEGGMVTGVGQMGHMLKVRHVTAAELYAKISIAIAFLNLLPIPTLDGGRLLELGVEALRGEDLPEGVRNGLSILGAAVILCIMASGVVADIAQVWR